jgi:hypothetical protein
MSCGKCYDAARRGAGGAVPGNMAVMPMGGGKAAVSALFDEQAERDCVLVQHGQAGELQPGCTREQAATFFRRAKAARDAGQERYSTGQTIREFIDECFAGGYDQLESLPAGRVALVNTRTGQRVVLRQKVAADYARVLTDHGEFKRNYG